MPKTLQSLFIWLGTVAAQWIGANLCVFLFSLILYSDRPATLTQFSINVAFMGFGFLIGVYGAGMLVLRQRKLANLLPRPRFFATLLGTLVPLLALGGFAWSVYQDRPAEFQTLIVEQWQINLAQTALWLSILFFHLPGWLKGRTGTAEIVKEAV